MRIRNKLLWLLAAPALVSAAQAPLLAAQLKIILPLNRVAYQTNETIDVSVARQDVAALAAGTLVLTLTGDDASKMTFSFPVDAVPLVGADARTTEHLHLNGWLLRPGGYTIQVDCDGATAQAPIHVYSHVRTSSYRTVHWWGPTGAGMAPEGEQGLGFNLMLGGTEEPSIRAGMDIMGIMVMGGGHQFDLKLTNDWSDPNVYIGANQRAAERVYGWRTMPNAIGAHLYDEPGLTYATNPHTGVSGPWDIDPQRAAYKAAFGEDQPWSDQIDTKDPAQLKKWTQISEFREGFMDAFWRSSYQMLSRFKPGFLTATQSMYGWWAFYDGYYFNVARSLPIISGHGGYDDHGTALQAAFYNLRGTDYSLRNFNPSYFLQFSLPRQMDKPSWYLPVWGATSPEQVREEYALSFITGIQGLSSPPGGLVGSPGAPGIVEMNQDMSRLGTIFAKPAYSPQDVAILYSKSNTLYAKHVMGSTIGSLGMVYLALLMDQYPMSAVLEEDLLDGTVAASHKAVVLTDIHYLDPNVIDALAAYIRGGGVVVMTDDCTVTIPGATKIGASWVDYSEQDKAALAKVTEKLAHDALSQKLSSVPTILDRAQPLAKALKVSLLKSGVRPAFETSVPDILPGRQVRGDIEYLFAVNCATTDVAGGRPHPVVSTIRLPNDGRPVYDGLRGGLLPFVETGNKAPDVAATLRFGPGQMYVLARTARPIGGVQVVTPTISRDYTKDTDPLTLNVSATLVDARQRVIAGAAPMEIKVIDPLGGVRYDIYRATDQGVCQVGLPMAVNDPAGTWTVTVRELLSNTEDKSTFAYQAVSQAGAAAGKTRRAVFYWADKDNVYRFFRDHRNITVVAGSSDYDAAAADRLSTILKPYNVTCTVVSAKDANKARNLTTEEAATWCGTSVAGGLKPGPGNNPEAVGYDLPGPTVLVGNPKDNPLIQHLVNAKVLPYPLTDDFPGRGHGMIAWHDQILGHDIESITLIANDADGMNEAVGTMFELAVGLDRPMPMLQPVSSTLTVATQMASNIAVTPIRWQAALPDSIDSLTIDGANVVAYSLDETQATFDAAGKLVSTKVNVKLPDEVKPSKDVSKLSKDKLVPDLAVKQVLPGANATAVAYWGGMLEVFGADGAVKFQQMMPHDVTAMAWQGDSLVLGMAGGQVVGLEVK